MRYLKTFESLSNQENLFELITQEEFLERQEKHGKDIPYVYQNESEKRRLIEFLKSEYQENILDYSLSSGQTLELELSSKDANKKFIEIICQSPDEWFYVKEYFYVWYKGQRFSNWRQVSYKTFEDSESVYESYFKCDSLDGLFEFIKNRRKRIETV